MVKYKVKCNVCCDMLFKIIIIFVFFDGIRSNLILGEYFSFLRELAIILLFLYARFVVGYRWPPIRKLYLYPFWGYHTFVCIATLFDFISGGKSIQFSILIKPYFFLVGIYLFYHYSSLTGKSIGYLFSYILKVAICFVIIDILFYFIPLPIFNRDEFWWGRISCGYPTMDVVTLAYALIIAIFANVNKGRIYMSFVILVLYVGMFAQYTGTGLVLLFVITVLAVIRMLFAKKKQFVPFLISLIIAFSFGTSFLFYYSKKYPEQYNNGLFLVQNKLAILLGEDTEINTMDIRKDQYKKQQKLMSPLEAFIGKNYSNVSTDAALISKSKAYMIEDQYNLNKICMGYIGYFLFVVFILATFLFFVKLKINDGNLKIMLIISVMIFSLNSKTLISLALFPNYVFFSIFIALGLIINKQNYEPNKNRHRLSLVG